MRETVQILGFDPFRSGVEIKSSESAMNRQSGRDARRQFAADRWINMKGQTESVEAVGSHSGVRIRSTYKIQWRGR